MRCDVVRACLLACLLARPEISHLFYFIPPILSYNHKKNVWLALLWAFLFVFISSPSFHLSLLTLPIYINIPTLVLRIYLPSRVPDCDIHYSSGLDYLGMMREDFCVLFVG